MKLIIDIPQEVYEKRNFTNFFGAWSVDLQAKFDQAIPIFDNATNGEVLDIILGDRVIVINGRIYGRLDPFDGRNWFDLPYREECDQ